MNKCLYEFEGLIWQVLTNPAADMLIIELRDEAKHQVSFAAIDLSHDQLLWKEITFEERWWIAATATDGKTLVLHTYPEPDNPQHKSYVAIDIPTLNTVWQSDTFQVLKVEDDWLTGYDQTAETSTYKSIHIHRQEEKLLTVADAADLLKEINKNLYEPFHYPETNPYFATVKQFILQYTNTSPVHGCEYLEYRHLILIGYYLQEAGALANYLLVLDAEGRLHLQERMDQHLQQIGLGTFFVAQDKLILIKEKNQLVSYALQDI